MPISPMRDAFAHHVWATVRLIDACAALDDRQLETTVPGTYGSIAATLRHLVGSDSWYLFDLTGDPVWRIDEKSMGLDELRAAVETDGPAWQAFLEATTDPDAIVREVDQTDGFERDATVGLRLAQALHHGTDHRSQICTALTTLGVEPPWIDVWAVGEDDGRVVNVG
jgi:uncharacterized damage-inducible protein DinB